MQTRQLPQKFPASLIPRRISLFELFARPENGPLGAGIESFRIEQRSLIVVPQEAQLAGKDAIDALAGIRPVADDVSQTIDFRQSLFLDIRENRIQRFQVSVYVANESFQGPRAFR